MKSIAAHSTKDLVRQALAHGSVVLLLACTLALVNSFGALVIAVLFLPMVLFLGVRGQLLAAGIVAGMILVFPMLRGIDVIPTQTILSWVESYDSGRGVSLQYRFENEDILLEHANEKPVFGCSIRAESNQTNS